MTTELQTPAGEELETAPQPAAETEPNDPAPQAFVFQETPPAGEETVRLLEELCQSARRQEESLRSQLKMARYCAGFLGGMLAVLVVSMAILLPWIGSLAGQAQQTLGQLQTVTENLSRIDFAATIDGVDQLVAQSGDSLETALAQVQEALAKIRELDIDGLNAAIADLQRAVRPLASLFGG